MITTDSGAVKIEGTDNWRNIFDAQNGTAEAVDQLTEDVAIVINGNKTTHTGGAAAGQFVLVRNSTITDITDGLYTAAQAIPANTVIDKTYLTSVSGGGLNALNNNIAEINLHNTSGFFSGTNTQTFTLDANSAYLVIVCGRYSGNSGIYLAYTGGSSILNTETVMSSSGITISSSGLELSIAFSGSSNKHISVIKLDTGS